MIELDDYIKHLGIYMIYLDVSSMKVKAINFNISFVAHLINKFGIMLSLLVAV